MCLIIFKENFKRFKIQNSDERKEKGKRHDAAGKSQHSARVSPNIARCDGQTRAYTSGRMNVQKDEWIEDQTRNRVAWLAEGRGGAEANGGNGGRGKGERTLRKREMQREQRGRRGGGPKGASAEAAHKVNVQGANLFEVHGPRSTSEHSCRKPSCPICQRASCKGPRRTLLAEFSNNTTPPLATQTRFKIVYICNTCRSRVNSTLSLNQHRSLSREYQVNIR